MLPDGDLRILVAPTTQLAAAATNFAVVDTIGWDYALIVGSDSEENKSAAAKWTNLVLGHCDTVPTDVTTDCTVLTQFQGGTAVDATHGFTIPTASTTVANGFIFKVDLKGIKRYLAIHFRSPVTDHVAAYAIMCRSEQAPEAAITTTTLARARNVVAG